MPPNPEIPERQQALLDVSPAETLAQWMQESPAAFIAAVSASGAPVEIPPSIVLGDEHQTDTRSLLEFVVPEDTKAVADAFIAALTRGIGVTKVRLASDPTQPLLLRYVDVRETHGVLVRFVVNGEVEGQPQREFRTSDLTPTRPRLGLMTKDEVAKILSIDTPLSLMLGWSETDMVGHQNIEFIHPDDHTRAIDNWMSSMSADRMATARTVRLRYLCKDGSWMWLETSNESHTEADGTLVIVASLFDVSEEMAAVEALRHSERFLRSVTDTVPVGLFHVSPTKGVAFVNPVLKDLIGDQEVQSAEDLSGVLLTEDGQPLLVAIEDAMATRVDADLDVSIPEREGRPESRCRLNLRPVLDDETVLGVLGCVVDVTELRAMADTDALTGLQNRRTILQTLESELLSHRGRVATLFLDLDHFKPINDMHGHFAGDRLLKEVADRLQDCLRPTDRAGRHGGDEFLIVCPGVSTQRAAMRLARRVQAVFGKPFELSGITVTMSASIGVSCGAPGVDAHRLVSSADSAMYVAKQARGGPPVFIEVLEYALPS